MTCILKPAIAIVSGPTERHYIRNDIAFIHFHHIIILHKLHHHTHMVFTFRGSPSTHQPIASSSCIQVHLYSLQHNTENPKENKQIINPSPLNLTNVHQNKESSIRNITHTYTHASSLHNLKSTKFTVTKQIIQYNQKRK